MQHAHRAALSLYARWLRAARRCPTHDKRRGVELIVRNKFIDSRGTLDKHAVTALLAEGEAELRTFIDMLSIREGREGSSATPISSSSVLGLRDDLPPSPSVSTSSVDTTSAHERLSVYELLARADAAIHAVDTRPGGRRALEALARVSAAVERATATLAAAQAAAAAALVDAEHEVSLLEGASSPVRGACDLRSRLLAARAAVQSVEPHGDANSRVRVQFITDDGGVSSQEEEEVAPLVQRWRRRRGHAARSGERMGALPDDSDAAEGARGDGEEGEGGGH